MTSLLARPWFSDRRIVARTRQVSGVLTSYGLDALVHHSGLVRFAPLLRLGKQPRPLPAEGLRLALGELGVTFTKLGQTLSTRADLLPPDFVAELAKLQDAAPPVPIEAIEETILADLGAPPDLLFDSFDPRPLASASIGQVHAATLLDGSPVVVKVRRPGVVEEVERDLDILGRLAGWVRTHAAFGRDYDLESLVSEFAYTLRNELDYVREGQNAERFARAFEGDCSVWIPRVHWALTTERVLTLDRVGGIKPTDLGALERLGVPRRTIAENAVRMFLHQVLDLGFFHADPHPGNYFVQPDGAIAVVDFGMVGRMSEAVRTHLLQAGIAAIRQDAEAVADALFALGVAGRDADRTAFTRDLDHLLGRYQGQSIRQLSAATVTHELSLIAHRHRLQLPSELALLMRVVSMSEGLGLMLDPDFRYFDFANPIFRAHWKQTRSLPAGVTRLRRAAADAIELGLGLPRRAGLLLGRIERGELELKVRHEGLDRLAHEFDGMTNRLAIAMILAASVVALAVALGVHGPNGIEPYLRALFTLGFTFSLAFGAWLLLGILRSGRR